MARKDRTIEWLLEPEQPSIRLAALTELQERDHSDPEVLETKEKLPQRGWGADILRAQHPGGWWVNEQNPYQPKYLSSNWMMLILADLGLRGEPRVSRACEPWIRSMAKPDGGFGSAKWSAGHLCTTGNMARALVQLGYVDHPAVGRAFRWLVEHQAEKGGWSCFGSGRNLDSWEPMSAFAALPKDRWTKSMKLAAEKGAEFFLERELHKQGAHYEPWYRFHYPVHYYYDLLVGLDFMTALGYGGDRRVSHAVEVLRKRRGTDGRWNLDAVHPDLEGGSAEWYAKHPKDAPTPFALETVGQPSKMITLRALVVLKRLDEQKPRG